ncbi:hypothetical protein ACFV6F_08035 [Kitasatospora phosalacinea]|uniref:hypothetical protein n=1 Tax=Kitasatospora phosalacinea TaxID=2065 RepID=UPI003666BB4C
MSARKPRRPPDVGWRPRGGGAPTLTVRRPLPRAVLYALVGWPVPVLTPGVCLFAAVVPSPVPARIVLVVAAVLLLAQSFRSVLRTSVEFRARELVVTNSFVRYTLSPDRIRQIGYSSYLHSPSGLDIKLTDGRSIDLGISIGLSPRRRAELCDLLHDWARANRVYTRFQVLGPKKLWSD